MTHNDTSGAPARYCGRLFRPEELGRIRQWIVMEPRHNRAALSRLVCQELGWLRPDGRLKDMACRVAMLRMHRDGIITLPPPEKGNSNGRIRPKFTGASDPRPALTLAAGALGELEFRRVNAQRDSSLWNELIERHHYLGYKPLPGAQMRYLVFAGPHLLAALGLGRPPGRWRRATSSSAGPLKSPPQPHRVVNNARFLILPGSRPTTLPHASWWSSDWGRIAGPLQYQRSSWKPVDRERSGRVIGPPTGYSSAPRRAEASWIVDACAPCRSIFLYPLDRHFRRELRAV